MNFQQALDALNDDFRVRREAWTDKTYLYKVGPDLKFINPGLIASLQAGGRFVLSPGISRLAEGKPLPGDGETAKQDSPWLMTWEDFTATDWALISEEQ